MTKRKPLVMHFVFSFGTGGLEQVLIDTVNVTASGVRHVVVSLTNASEAQRRALPKDVELHVLHKREGHDPKVWVKAWNLIKQYSPNIVHTYNFACLEFQIIALLCGVPKRLHAEHGRLASDPKGLNRKHRFLRRRMRNVVNKWVAVSDDLRRWLVEDIGVAGDQVLLIRNGVDVDAIKPRRLSSRDNDEGGERRLEGFCGDDAIVFGTVGRLDPVKNHHFLLDVWMRLEQKMVTGSKRFVLAIIGDGPLYTDLKTRVDELGLGHLVWLPGIRYNVPELLGDFDVFILPSIAEGTPVTVLEAMACELPIIASDVGGLAEIVPRDVGTLLSSFEPDVWADTLVEITRDNARLINMGVSGRRLVSAEFNKTKMGNQYIDVYHC